MMLTKAFEIFLSEARFVFQAAINPLSAKLIKWSNTLKQFVGKLPTNCLSVFDHFSGLALKGLKTTNSEKVLITFCI